MNKDEEISSQISRAIGPSPWYWNTFPDIETPSGETLKWIYMGAEGEWAYIVGLSSGNEEKAFKLLLNTYTRAFFIPPHYIGIWFTTEEGTTVQCFNPDKLLEFSLNNEISRFKQKKEPYYCNGEIDSEIIINSNLGMAPFKIEVPKQFKTLNEILIISSTRITRENEEAYTIVALDSNNNIINTYPQKWFTADKFDLGYEWITRITRDKDTGRFIGDGIRIDQFELCDDGMNLLRWI